MLTGLLHLGLSWASPSPTTGFQLFSYYVKPVGERRHRDVPRQLGGARVVVWDEPAVGGWVYPRVKPVCSINLDEDPDMEAKRFARKST